MRESFTLRAAACGRTGDSARSTVPPVISHSPLNLSLPRAKAHGVQGPIFFSSTVALVVVGITVAVTPSTPQHSSVSVRQLALQRVPGRVALRLIGDGDADAGRRDVRASATYVRVRAPVRVLAAVCKQLLYACVKSHALGGKGI